MKQNPFAVIGLRSLILAMSLIILATALIVSCYAAYRVQRQALLDSAYDFNRLYAQKIASTLDGLLYDTQKRLQYSSERMISLAGDRHKIDDELQRLMNQDDTFNGVLLIDSNGKITSKQPGDLHYSDSFLASVVDLQKLRANKVYYSDVLQSNSGDYFVFISTRMMDSAGTISGFLLGIIYINKSKALHTLTEDNFNRDGTVTYIVDRKQVIIQHPVQRIQGDVALNNKMPEVVLGGLAGDCFIEISTDESLLTGFAPVKNSGWAVISQRSEAKVLSSLQSLIKQLVVCIIPSSFVIVAGVFFLTHLISKPLRQIAAVASGIDKYYSLDKIRKIHAWYYEVDSIKRNMFNGAGLLQEKMKDLSLQAQTDPLTGLANRRTMAAAIEKLASAGQSFSLIAVDIDHFKKINDRFGHDAGDFLLQKISILINQSSRTGDLACRTGGEEFLLILPRTTLTQAVEIGERLRLMIESTSLGRVGKVTASLGVSCWPNENKTVQQIIKVADDNLYVAKQNGRNKVVSME